MISGSFAVLLRNMDYDATDIASTYDRGRDHGPEFLGRGDRLTQAALPQVHRGLEPIFDLSKFR